MAENNLFPNAFPRKVYCSPKYSYIRADGMHGWNLAIMEDQEPYRRDTCLKMVTAYNEYDQLKEENKILRRSFDNLRAEVINILSRGKGYTISGDEYDRLQNAANPINILSPSNIETNANGE